MAWKRGFRSHVYTGNCDVTAIYAVVSPRHVPVSATASSGAAVRIAPAIRFLNTGPLKPASTDGTYLGLKSTASSAISRQRLDVSRRERRLSTWTSPSKMALGRKRENNVILVPRVETRCSFEHKVLRET